MTAPLNIYRLAYVGGPVPWRIVDAEGNQVGDLCNALSKLAERENGLSRFRRWASAICWALNMAEARVSGAAELLCSSVLRFRKVVKAMLSAAGAHFKDKVDYIFVSPTERLWSKVSDAIVALGKIADLMVGRCFDKSPANREADKIRQKGFRTAFRYFVVGRNPSAAPRTGDPRVHDRLRQALEDIGASEPIILAGDIARYAGKRSFQVRELTLFDLFVTPTEDFEFRCGSKGDRDRHSERGSLPPTIYNRLLAYIAGPRAELTGWTLEQIRLVAKDPKRREQLKVPVLTEDGKNPIAYNRLYRFYRVAAKKAGLYYRDDRYPDVAVRKYVTFHLLRHEYVHDWLDRIIDLSPEAYAREIRALISYMNWKSGVAMVAWYSHHHELKIMRMSVAEQNALLDCRLEEGSLLPTASSLMMRRKRAEAIMDCLL